MSLFPFREMLEIALKNNFAVGYFEAWNEESIEAVVRAGEEMSSPLIIGFGGALVNQDWLTKWGLSFYAAVGRVTAEKAAVPVAFILNEVKSLELGLRGIALGFNVVMIHTSHLPYGENAALNKKLAKAAHARQVGVEGELGYLPMVGVEDESSLTDPDEAGKFVRETGIDALSVSIGNVHLLTDGDAQIDMGLLERIRDAARIPIVIHGGTGFPPELVSKAIDLGVAKFNIGTILKKVYYEGVKSEIAKIGDKADMQRVVGSREKEDYTTEGKRRLKDKVIELIHLYKSDGKACLFKK